MILEKSRTQQEQFAEIVHWLHAEAKAHNIDLEIMEQNIEERSGDCYQFVLVPVRVIANPDSDDNYGVLASLQTAWNHQEPPPDKMLTLYPAGIPRFAG